MTETFTPADLAAELASGKYKQGRYQLRTDGQRYCCLGVAAKMDDCSDTYLDNVSIPYFGEGARGEEHGYYAAHSNSPLVAKRNKEIEAEEAKLSKAFPWLDQANAEELAEANDADTSGTFNDSIHLLDDMR